VTGRVEMNQSEAVEMPRRGKVQKRDFPPALGKPAQNVGFPHFHRLDDGFHSPEEKKKEKPLDARRPLHRCATLLAFAIFKNPAFSGLPATLQNLPFVKRPASIRTGLLCLVLVLV